MFGIELVEDYLVSRRSFLNIFYGFTKQYVYCQRKAKSLYRAILKNSITKVTEVDTQNAVSSVVFQVWTIQLFFYFFFYMYSFPYQLMYKWEPTRLYTKSANQHFYILEFADRKDKVILKSHQSFQVPDDFDCTNQTSLLCVEIITNDGKQHDITHFFDRYRHSFVARSSFTVQDVITLVNAIMHTSYSQQDAKLLIVKGDALEETLYKDTDILVL